MESLLHSAKEKRRAAKRRSRESGVGGQESGVGGRESGVGGQRIPTRSVSEESTAGGEEQYLQKQALFTEPLSLDDLLRDDLDEGPLTPADFASNEKAGGAEDGGEHEAQGGVIDYEGDFSPPPPQSVGARRRPHRRVGKPRRDRGRGGDKSKREELEARPRENFGKKRGGKRVLGPRKEGRGPAGEKGGNFRFRPKKKKQKAKAHDVHRQSREDNVRRGERRGGKQAKQFGKGGGKRKGRR